MTPQEQIEIIEASIVKMKRRIEQDEADAKARE
jgi:hypothetical protein